MLGDVLRRLDGHEGWTLLSAALIAGLLLWLDYVTGPLVQFPVTFLVPVVMASWFGGRAWGTGFGVVLPAIRASFYAAWPSQQVPTVTLLNAAIRILVFVTFALLVDSVARRQRELRRERDELERLLPMCAWCKRVREDDGSWASIESYLLRRKEQAVTSGICPDCRAREFQREASEPNGSGPMKR